VIIPCWNQLEFTRRCIPALVRHTRRPWELIVVNNGSTDRTAEYLAGVQDAAPVPVTVIANETNRGFPAAINQGLQVARGEYLVLLNNDVVVTDGWLDQLVALTAADLSGDAPQRPAVRQGLIDGQSAGRHTVDGGAGSGDPRPTNAEAGEGREFSTENTEVTERAAETQNRMSEEGTAAMDSGGASADDSAMPRANRRSWGIGLAGPMSNYATPPQLVEGVPYADLDEMHAFARRWRDEHRGRWFRVRKLSGFCLLLKRAVYDAIGGLDERFGLGFFDDDDLAERARRAGFELAVAQDLFVHHFGSRTFAGNGVDANALLEENSQRFAAKWGGNATGLRPVALEPWSSWPGFFAASQREFAKHVDERSQTPARPNLAGFLIGFVA
jgi:GT2 family glycosyltransferase